MGRYPLVEIGSERRQVDGLRGGLADRANHLAAQIIVHVGERAGREPARALPALQHLTRRVGDEIDVAGRCILGRNLGQPTALIVAVGRGVDRRLARVRRQRHHALLSAHHPEFRDFCTWHRNSRTHPAAARSSGKAVSFHSRSSEGCTAATGGNPREWGSNKGHTPFILLPLFQGQPRSPG